MQKSSELQQKEKALEDRERAFEAREREIMERSVSVTSMRCIICRQNPPTAACDCGHVFCLECAASIVNKFHQCALCRKPVKSYMKIYFS